jgi:hypothetical protein
VESDEVLNLLRNHGVVRPYPIESPFDASVRSLWVAKNSIP